jgi:hypothetical protein
MRFGADMTYASGKHQEKGQSYQWYIPYRLFQTNFISDELEILNFFSKSIPAAFVKAFSVR